MTTENIGEIVIAPRVLEVITGIAATKVEGVYALQIKMLRIVYNDKQLGTWCLPPNRRRWYCKC